MYAIYTHVEYGYSGNELSPEPIARTEYVLHSLPDEKLGDFMVRAYEIGVEKRKMVKSKPVKSYSVADGLDCRIIDPDNMTLIEDFII